MPRRPGTQGNDSIFDMLLTNTALRYNTTPQNVVAETRKRESVEPRQVVAAFAYSVFDMRGQWVALRLGFRTHANVIHCLRTVRNIYVSNKDTRKVIDLIASDCGIDPRFVAAMIEPGSKFCTVEKVKILTNYRRVIQRTARRFRRNGKRRDQFKDPVTGHFVRSGGVPCTFFR